MAKEIEDFENDEMDETAKAFFPEEEAMAPVVRDYSERRILIWEEDDTRRGACLEVLSDLLVGATFKAVRTEAEAMEREFVKCANNYPGSILVAINMAPLTLPDERDPAKTELLRRLFDIEKPVTQLHG